MLPFRETHAQVILGLSKITRQADGNLGATVAASATQSVFPGSKLEFLLPGVTGSSDNSTYVLEVSDSYYGIVEGTPIYCGNPPTGFRKRCDCPGSVNAIAGLVWKTPSGGLPLYNNPNATVRGSATASGCPLALLPAPYVVSVELPPVTRYKVSTVRSINPTIYVSFYNKAASNRTSVMWDGVSTLTMPPVDGISATIAGSTAADPNRVIRVVGSQIVQDIQSDQPLKLLSDAVSITSSPDASKFCWNRVVNGV